MKLKHWLISLKDSVLHWMQRSEAEWHSELYKLQGGSKDSRPLVFGIGLPRTGTSSLTKAMRRLGWNAVHSTYQFVPRGKTLEFIENSDFNCFTDCPIWERWEEIHRRYPRAAYILTTRDRESWERSLRRFFKDEQYVDYLLQLGEEHEDKIRATIPPERLLVIPHDGERNMTELMWFLDIIPMSQYSEVYPHAHRSRSFAMYLIAMFPKILRAAAGWPLLCVLKWVNVAGAREDTYGGFPPGRMA